MKPRRIASSRKRLLAWYDRHARDLPWRRTRDPYAIWLSEIMLQQTTVATVIPRWERFLSRWPTLPALAAAPQDDVLHEWTGLGYYARARNLHRAAGIIVAQLGGNVPARFDDLLKLPGMGVYTSAAVASIAFGEKVAVLDANVERVLARVHAIAEDARATETKKRLRAHAAKLLDPRRPGDFNQAMMELGAVICTPKNPRCLECPLQDDCEANLRGEQERYPVIRKKAPIERVREAALLIAHDEKFLLLKRPPDVSFGGMWEPPRVVCEPDEEPEEAALRAAHSLAGIEAREARLLLQLRHVVMRRGIELSVYTCEKWSGEVRLTEHLEHRWATAAEWMQLPKSTTQAKVAELLSKVPTSPVSPQPS